MPSRVIVVAVGLLCATPLMAGETKPVVLTRAQTEADLLSQGLAMKLPDGITGQNSSVFDAKFLTLRSGKDEIWVGLRGGKDNTPCSLDQLRTAAKGESGFRAIVREELASGIPVVVSSHRDDKGHDTFLVQACPAGTRAICGAEKLTDDAAARRVSSLCGTLRAGSKPSDVDPRMGTWMATFADDSARDRAAGRGGSGKRVRASITISRDGIQAKATYAVSETAAKKPAATAELNGAHIAFEHFTAAPIAVKTAWPLYLPASFDGNFTSADTLVLDGKTYTRKR